MAVFNWLFAPTHRPWTVYLGAAALLMLAFVIFAAGTGWPASPESCFPAALRLQLERGQPLNAAQLDVFWATNECFCEKFDPNLLLNSSTGVRQGVNTWSNLYALITAGVVALFLCLDRGAGANQNALKSNSLKADLYVFCVLFLGFGSMWFHASMSATVSWFDSFSMFVFASFLVFYTIDRWLFKRRTDDGIRGWVFWVGYGGTVVVFTVLGKLGVPSFILIAVLVAAYLVFEFLFAGWISGLKARIFWVTGFVFMGTAILAWAMSQTGGPWCTPESAFQPHGLIWHPFAGVMAVMMYFYWREDRQESDRLRWTHFPA